MVELNDGQRQETGPAAVPRLMLAEHMFASLKVCILKVPM